MLKRMGWEKGKGLGMNEDGSTNPIKASLKNDSKGLGFAKSYENNWVDHQDDFAALLTQLNGEDDVAKSDSKKAAVSNLEHTSKSQKGLYYRKFAKGKNLSLYKAEDMNAIFGTPVSKSELCKEIKTETEDPQELKSKKKRKNSSKENTRKRKKLKDDADFIVKSQYSVDEYFAMQKAKALSRKTVKIENGKRKSGDKPQLVCPEATNDQSSCVQSKKKHKKKKKDKSLKKLKVINNETIAPIECPA